MSNPITCSELISTRLSADGVLLATIDMPGRSMNVFSEALMDALEAIIDQVEANVSIRGVVITSGKSSFLAGADLPMVRAMTERAKAATHAEMFVYCGRIGRLFLRIERSKKPWVAAVNGTALGGGLELAMACRARLIDTQCKALIGLPEVKLGLLPGAGGTQRLPRFVGLALGLDLLLSGRSLNPLESVKAGLFEAASIDSSLLASALAKIEALILEGPSQPKTKYQHLDLACPPDSETSVRALAAHHGISEDALSHYPAYRAIIRSVLAGAALDLAAASDAEMTRFLDLMFDPVADRMITTLFIERQRVEKAIQSSATNLPRQIRVGPLPSSSSGWKALLENSGIVLLVDSNLESGTVEFDHDSIANPVRLVLSELTDLSASESSMENPDPNTHPCLILSARSEHGRVIECVLPSTDQIVAPGSPSSATRGILAALAKKLQCFLFFTSRPSTSGAHLHSSPSSNPSASVLRSISQANAFGELTASLQRAALAGAQAFEVGRVNDPGILDVAAVLAGLSPAYTGGPLSYAWHHREHLRPSLKTQLGDSYISFEQKIVAHWAKK